MMNVLQDVERRWRRDADHYFWSLASSVAAFASVCSLSCATQLLLGISTGTLPPVPTVAGFTTVAAASLASHWAAASTQQHQKTGRLPKFARTSTTSAHHYLRTNAQQMATSLQHPRQMIPNDQVLAQKLRICVIGWVAFQLLGGRFWAISPSSLTAPGSFARFSLPATERYATAQQRAALERLGRRWGCHTCGSRMLWRRKAPRFVGDHMPPKAVAEQLRLQWHRRLLRIETKFQFYPQCVRCSTRQGNLLSAATRQAESVDLARVGGGRTNAYFHGWRPRTWHLAGGVVGAVAVSEEANRFLDTAQDWALRQWRDLKGKLPLRT